MICEDSVHQNVEIRFGDSSEAYHWAYAVRDQAAMLE